MFKFNSTQLKSFQTKFDTKNPPQQLLPKMFRNVFTNIIDFFWAQDGQSPEELPSAMFLNPENFIGMFSNPGEIFKNLIDKAENELDDPDNGGMYYALLSNYYFMKAQNPPNPDDKHVYTEKSQMYLSKVYEKGQCKGFLMLTMLYGIGQIDSLDTFGLRFGLDLEATRLLNSTPPFKDSTETFSLIGFNESLEVKKAKCIESAFKALEINPTKTLEFCKTIPSVSNEVLLHVVKEFLLQKETIYTLQSKVANLQLQLDLQPSLQCSDCKQEVGGGQLFKQAKHHFTQNSTSTSTSCSSSTPTSTDM